MDGKNNLSGRTLIMNEKIDLFKKIIEDSNNIVFFGGAGVSTESGIPDFRSKDGLYNQKYNFPPEEPDAGYRHNTLFVIRKETDKKIPT